MDSSREGETGVRFAAAATSGPRSARASSGRPGPERHGWRVVVETPLRYRGVRRPRRALRSTVPAREIITYPNILWTVPGGAVTVEVRVALTPQDAGGPGDRVHRGAHQLARVRTARRARSPEVARYRAEAQARAAAAASGPPLKAARDAGSVRHGPSAVLRDDRQSLRERTVRDDARARSIPGPGCAYSSISTSGRSAFRARSCGSASRSSLGDRSAWGSTSISPPRPYREFVRSSSR